MRSLAALLVLLALASTAYAEGAKVIRLPEITIRGDPRPAPKPRPATAPTPEAVAEVDPGAVEAVDDEGVRLEVEAAPALEAETPVAEAMALRGHAGVWLPEADAREALRLRLAEPLYAERIDLLLSQLTLADQEINYLDEALDATAEVERTLEAEAEHQRRRADAAEAWWRHPGVWMAVGSIATMAVAVGVAAVAD